MAPTARLSRLRVHRQLGEALARSYHSSHYSPPPGPFNAVETAILSASYAHVPTHGFTQAALGLGAKDAGYLDVSTNIFPSGPFSLVQYHLMTKRLGLAQLCDSAFAQRSDNAKPLGVGAKVKALTWARL